MAEGISVNVTLIFALDRYRAVMNAFLAGLEQAREAGKPTCPTIHSVASFFVSRVDTEIDKRLDAIGTDEAKALRGKAGVANARLAYQAYEEVFSTPRWQTLEDDGANAAAPAVGLHRRQGPGLPRHHVRHRAGRPGTVNTMPEKTLDAAADHGEVTGDTVDGPYYAEAAEVLDSLERLGISYAEVTALLEREGVDKFEKSWGELLDGVTGRAREGRPREQPRRRGHAGRGRRRRRARARPGRRPRRQPALRAGRHAVGRGGRGRVGQAAVLGRAAPHLAPAASARSRRCATSSPATGCRPRRALRHGRLLARPRGHLRHRRCRPSSCSTPPTPTSCAAR